MGLELSGNRTPWLILLLLAGAALSGCSGKSAQGAVAAPSLSPTFDDTTGAIHGTVLDDEGLPVADAQAQVRERKDLPVAATSAVGDFVFNHLEAGMYTLDVAKIGFAAFSKRVEVTAGKATRLAINLVAVRVEAPHSTLNIHDGLIVCGTGTYVLTQVACGAHDSNQKFLHRYTIDPNMSAVLWEVVWTSSQALSKDLVFSLERDECGLSCPSSSTFASVDGCCRLRVALNATQFDIGDVKAHTKGATIQSRTFPAFSSSENLPTVYTNQRFTIYVEYFYGPVPDDFRTTRTNIPDS